MRGLSLTQPWATLVALGEKAIETRSWSTPYRGPLLIQAAKGFPKDCQHLCWRAPFAGALIGGGFDRAEQLPRGAIVAVARLAWVLSTDLFVDERLPRSYSIAGNEFAFGDFSAGRFGWVLQDVQRLKTPVPCKGSLGLWAVPPDVIAAVSAQLKVCA
jgi:hypothetical protein